jgi:anti-anti-sigma regulatory factor/HAMP domain-containing protein
MNASPAVEARAELALPRWRQLRWRLVLYFVLLATVPLLGAVGFALLQMRAHSERQVINQLESVVELKHDQLDRWLESSRLVIDSFLSDSNRRARLVDFVGSASPDTVAQAVINTELSELSQLQSAGIQHFHLFFVYDRAGKVLAASDPAQIGKVVTIQPYYAGSLKAASLQPPYYAVGSSALTMVLTRPLLDSSGQVVGVLGGEVNLDDLAKIMLERTGLGASGETYLVSQENNYLLTPSRSPGYSPNRAYHSQGIDRALAGQQGAGIYDDYRTPPVEVVGAYRWIPELNAALLAEIDESEALGLFGQTARLSIGLAALAAVVAALIGLFVATRVAQPITMLAQVARRITAGALDQQVAVTQRDEIGLLATAFNQMTDRLRQTLAGLEQRVAERTSDLERANAEAQQALADLRESLRERDLLSATVRELSSPVVPVVKGILAMPLIGAIDTERAALLTESLLTGIERHRARAVIMDVTGVPVIDTQVARTIMRAAEAARLLGATPILVGVRPELAQTIVGLGLDLRGLVTCADLQSGVSYAMGAAGQQAITTGNSASSRPSAESSHARPPVARRSAADR